ncbi:3-oxoacyl-ACP reductase [Saccharopolyspora sp. TS4A08]|uniref:3-oxoacyl-ACP reductase n=1 Tax=Saccharopolyspora ipomoeae TaxID=3042027 RepID=A0ABT6PNZ4_9PSEU|nr:3-oxoacyl-ACP reductase [Saccharopolyspora sp. TS4A08]MDI2029683.1 3-oxoacyl-ACP reductase [Saccharopolyspora sp. TS4A08]
MSSVDGKVAIVTGAGAGLGRAEALALARAGANVVVNDVTDAAHAVVAEIEEIGTKAVAVVGDVSDSEVSGRMMAAATEQLGGLHVVVNNAGLLRDRMLFKMTDQEWDDVLRVHLRGHFLLSRNATAHWRQEYKDSGATYGSIINTASEAFLLGSAGQPNYAAAKGGIASLTVSTARAMARMGVRANAICPRARTAMTAETFGDAPGDGVDPMSVEHVAPLVAYLAGPSAQAISGQVFVVHSGTVALLAPPTIERKFAASGELWTQAELESALGAYFADRDPEKSFAANGVLDIP